jgi:phage shock protein C
MTAHDETRRLYKSRSDRMLDGVCGGVAEYFGLDSTLVRLAWVLLVLVGGMGILLYLVAMIIMPVDRREKGALPAAPARERNSKFWGILLVLVGTVWFLGNLGLPLWHHWWGLSWDIMLPVLLILAGVAFLFGGRDSLTVAPPASPPVPGGPESPEPVPPSHGARLYRSRAERKIFGVCGGIAAYFNVDPTIVRLLCIIMAFASFGAVLLMYIIMAIVMPREPVPA